MHIPPWPNCGGEHLYSYKSTCVYTCSYTIQMKYMLVATLTEYCSCDVYTGLLEPIRHSNIAPMGLSNEAGLSVDCGGQSSISANPTGFAGPKWVLSSLANSAQP